MKWKMANMVLRAGPLLLADIISVAQIRANPDQSMRRAIQ
jgi:hypothetical protein